MSRPLIIAPHPHLTEAALRARIAEVSRGRADGGSSIRIRRAGAGTSKSLIFPANALGGGRTRPETTRIAQNAVADILAASMLDEEGLRNAKDAQSGAWDVLSMILHVLHPDKVSAAVAFPGSPWRRAWCMNGDDGGDILAPDVVEGIFRDVPHVLEVSVQSDNSMYAGFQDALRFEPEEFDVAESMRRIAGLRGEGIL